MPRERKLKSSKSSMTWKVKRFVLLCLPESSLFFLSDRKTVEYQHVARIHRLQEQKTQKMKQHHTWSRKPEENQDCPEYLDCHGRFLYFQVICQSSLRYSNWVSQNFHSRTGNSSTVQSFQCFVWMMDVEFEHFITAFIKTLIQDDDDDDLDFDEDPDLDVEGSVGSGANTPGSAGSQVCNNTCPYELRSRNGRMILKYICL